MLLGLKGECQRHNFNVLGCCLCLTKLASPRNHSRAIQKHFLPKIDILSSWRKEKLEKLLVKENMM